MSRRAIAPTRERADESEFEHGCKRIHADKRTTAIAHELVPGNVCLIRRGQGPNYKFSPNTVVKVKLIPGKYVEVSGSLCFMTFFWNETVTILKDASTASV